MDTQNELVNILKVCCREEGIRTLDTLVAYTHFPGVRLRPLGHLSITISHFFEWSAKYQKKKQRHKII